MANRGLCAFSYWLPNPMNGAFQTVAGKKGDLTIFVKITTLCIVVAYALFKSYNT